MPKNIELTFSNVILILFFLHRQISPAFAIFVNIMLQKCISHFQHVYMEAD